MAYIIGIRRIVRTQVFALAAIAGHPCFADHEHANSKKTQPGERIALETVFEEIDRGNPDLESLRAQSEAAHFQVGTETYFPAPTVEVGSMGLQGPLSSAGHMQTSFQISQEVPFPTKVYNRREAMEKESLAAVYMVESKRLLLRAEAKKAYIEYWRAHEMQDLLEERSAAVGSHTRRLRAEVISTQLQQAHILSVDNDVELLKNEIEATKAQELSAKGQLNTLMGKNPFDAMPLPEEIPLSTLPPSPSSQQVLANVDQHPDAKEAAARTSASESQASAARAEWLPNLTLQYRRNNNTKSAADASNSELMAGITLPFLYFWQAHAQSRTAEAKLTKARAEERSKRNTLALQILQKHSELASLRAQYLRLSGTVLHSADRRLRLAHSIAPSDMESLEEHRGASESQVQLKQKALDLRADFEKALIDYESLVPATAKPPGSTAMKLLVTLLVSTAAGLTACSQKDPTETAMRGEHTHATMEEYYSCPMHHNVRSEKPGECPICHMQLVKVRVPTSATKAEASPPVSSSGRKIKFYRHPMTPEVHSKVPAKDNMGMDYIPVFEDETASAADTIAGRTTVTLDAQQEALSGTQAVKVEERDLKREIHAPGRVVNGQRVSFQIYEEDLEVVKSGQAFRATVPMFSGMELKGHLSSVETFLDPMTRTVRVNGTLLDSRASRLPPEGTISGIIEVNLGRVIAVPEDAVLHTGTRDLVYVTDGKGTYRPRAVVLGAKAESYFEIKDGLKTGEMVSSGPNFLLDSESRIRASYGEQK